MSSFFSMSAGDRRATEARTLPRGFRFALLLAVGFFAAGVSAAQAAPEADAVPSRLPPTPQLSLSGHVFELDSWKNFKAERWMRRDGPEASNRWPIAAAGDFDADGRADLVAWDSPGRRMLVLFSRDGEGFVPGPVIALPKEVEGDRLLAGFFDANDTFDFLVWSASRNPGWFGLQASAGSFDWRPHVLFTQERTSTGNVLVGDFNGNGTDDLFAYGEPVSRSLVHYDPTYSAGTVAPLEFERGLAPPLLAANLNGNPGAELLALYAPNSGFTDGIMVASLIPPWYAQYFPAISGMHWQRAFAGDFDGDGMHDILVESDNPHSRWWIGASLGLSAVPLALPRDVQGGGSADVPVFVADFDGNGLDDILFTGADRELRIHLSFVSRGVEGAGVKLDSGEETETDRRGFFRVSGNAAEPFRIGVTKAGMGFARAHRNLGLLSRSLRDVVFLGESLARRPSGAAFSRFNEGTGPYLCLGYIPGPESSGVWGSFFSCPANYAAYETGDGEAITLSCCRLPFNDVLEPQSFRDADGVCPDGSVLTEGSYNLAGCPTCGDGPRCTRINSARYQLGPKHRGTYFGMGGSMKNSSRRIDRSEIPLAIRYGVGRDNFESWSVDGCIGAPPGSLLVEVRGKSCGEKVFRELQYRGRKGDPPQGTPVQMFPDCRTLENLYDPTAGCRLLSRPTGE